MLSLNSEISNEGKVIILMPKMLFAAFLNIIRQLCIAIISENVEIKCSLLLFQ